MHHLEKSRIFHKRPLQSMRPQKSQLFASSRASAGGRLRKERLVANLYLLAGEMYQLLGVERQQGAGGLDLRKYESRCWSELKVDPAWTGLSVSVPIRYYMLFPVALVRRVSGRLQQHPLQ